MSDHEFENVDAGASNTYLAEAGRMKPGSLLMMKTEFPCKVVNFSTAKPGKHGSAKAMIMGKDIYTDRQYEETFGTGDMIPAPVVTKTEYTCLDCDPSDVLTLLTAEGETKEDLNLPTAEHLKDVSKNIKDILEAGVKECLVTVQKWGERELVTACREGSEM